ncbi:MAG: FG-GAP-like repeat-containing protein, partial [Candidatus Aminicenantales bacterium]
MDTEPKDNILRSWKEIATHLGYDERTCYRWEQKYGMPVHRAEAGASKSHVVAYKDELDSWFKATFTKHGRDAPPKPVRRPYSPWLLAGLVPVAAVVFLLLRDRTSVRGQPADFHISGSVLIVVDESGKELWRRDTKVEGLLDEDNYRVAFQSVDSSKSLARLPSLAVRDIDGDGRNEVLFAVQKRDDAYGEGRLYCFDSRGKERWRFDAGREMRFGGRTFSPDYRIYGFGFHDFNGDGRQEVIVISYHYPQWPCQVALLDARGRMTGEFWNSGFLNDLAFPDLDGDGREEMVVVGVN